MVGRKISVRTLITTTCDYEGHPETVLVGGEDPGWVLCSHFAGLVGSGVDGGFAESIFLLWRRQDGLGAALAVMAGES